MKFYFTKNKDLSKTQKFLNLKQEQLFYFKNLNFYFIKALQTHCFALQLKIVAY